MAYVRLFEPATKYSAELITGGFTSAKIAMIQTLENKLNEAQPIKEGKIKERLVFTHERISLYNKFWDVLLKINKTTKAVYIDNFAMLQKYELPHKKE